MTSDELATLLESYRQRVEQLDPLLDEDERRREQESIEKLQGCETWHEIDQAHAHLWLKRKLESLVELECTVLNPTLDEVLELACTQVSGMIEPSAFLRGAVFGAAISCNILITERQQRLIDEKIQNSLPASPASAQGQESSINSREQRELLEAIRIAVVTTYAMPVSKQEKMEKLVEEMIEVKLGEIDKGSEQ